MRNMFGLFVLCMAIAGCEEEQVTVLSPVDVELVDAGVVPTTDSSVGPTALENSEKEEQAPVHFSNSDTVAPVVAQPQTKE